MTAVTAEGQDMKSGATENLQWIGNALRKARTKRKETLKNASECLKVPLHLLEKFENSEFENLNMAPVFLKGALRSYARHLELDSEKMVKALSSMELEDPELREVLGELDPSRNPQMAAYAAIILAAVLLPVMFYFQQNQSDEIPLEAVIQPAAVSVQNVSTDTAEEENEYKDDGKATGEFMGQPMSQAEVVENEEIADSTAEDSGLESTGALTDEATAEEMPRYMNAISPAMASVDSRSDEDSMPRYNANTGLLHMVFHETSWIEIRDGAGERIAYQLIPAGHERTYSGEKPFDIKLGNAEGVAVFFEDKKVDLKPYTRNRVATLNTARLDD